MRKMPLCLFIFLAVSVLLGGCGNNEISITRLEDARHAKIGVMTGATSEAITIARFPEADVKSFDDIMDAVAALKSGQLDAIVTAYPTALQVTKKTKN